MMPAWVEKRMERLLPSMQETYGREKGRRVAWGTATQMGHRLGKTPKSYGTPSGRQEARRKHRESMREYQKTAEDVMWSAYWDELAKLSGLGYKPGAPPPVAPMPTLGKGGVKSPTFKLPAGGAPKPTMPKAPAPKLSGLLGYKPGAPPPTAPMPTLGKGGVKSPSFKLPSGGKMQPKPTMPTAPKPL